MEDMAHDQSPEEQVSANETDGSTEANPFSAPEAPVEAVVPPSMEGFDAIELASLKTCKTGFKLLFISIICFICACGTLILGQMILTADLMAIVGLASIGLALLGALLAIIGNGMLITAPARSNAKKLYQLSFACLLAVLVMPFVGFDLLGNRGAIGVVGPVNFILETVRGALGMLLLTITLQLVLFISWCLGTNRLMTFVNEPVNAARALSLLKLFCVLSALPVAGIFFAESRAIPLVIGLASLVVSIILFVRLITTCRGGRDAIARMLG